MRVGNYFPLPSDFLLKFFIFFFYVYEYFTFRHVSISHVRYLRRLKEGTTSLSLTSGVTEDFQLTCES